MKVFSLKLSLEIPRNRLMPCFLHFFAHEQTFDCGVLFTRMLSMVLMVVRLIMAVVAGVV